MSNAPTNSLSTCIVALAFAGIALAYAGDADATSTRGGEESERSDDAIAEALYLEFLDHGGIPADEIDVDVEDGVVSLSGDVPHALAHDEVLQLTRHTRGVRALVDRLDVRTPVVEDERIVQHVTAALLADPRIRLGRFTVEAEDGRVEVRGEVASRAHGDLVLDVVRGIRGVARVVDRLALEASPDRSAEVMRSEIRARIEDDVVLSARELSVDVGASGGVTLRGAVNGLGERDRAEDLAWVRGVESVSAEEVTIDPEIDTELRATTPDRSDAQIRRAAEDALRDDPRVGPPYPNVRVDQSTITLSGNMLTLAARDAALDDAQRVVGGGLVVDSMTVVPRDDLEPADVEDEVRDALARNAWLADDTLQVRMTAGRANLYGRVDSRLERVWAGRVARGFQGVVDVENHLAVPEASIVDASDEELADAIRAQWLWSTDILSDDSLEVEVRAGVAILTGYASSVHERRAAAAEARQTDVVGVINDIVIGVVPRAPVIDVQGD